MELCMVFFLYFGSSSEIKCTGSNVVMKLLETLPKGENYKLFFDNLLLQIKQMKILTTATIRMDVIKGCPLVAVKDLRKQERGSSCYMVDLNTRYKCP